MAVSDRHGGGLTLLRVLGPALNRIQRFIYLQRIAERWPAVDALRNRSETILPSTAPHRYRRVIGCRAAFRLSTSRIARRIHANRVASRVDDYFPNAGELHGLVCPQGLDSLYATEAIGQRRSFHYVTWMMDDHLARYADGRLQYRPGDRSLLEKHLQTASHVFVISPAMGEHYQREFGISSTVLFGGTEPPSDWPARPSSDDASCDVRLAYLGGVGPWQIDALAVVADALKEARATLDIYSYDSNLPPQLRKPGVSARGALEASEVRDRMRSYDAVVLPISFADELKRMSNLNIATKMAECLASGTVTLLVGPADAAMSRYLTPTGAALLVHGTSTQHVAATVQSVADPNVRADVLRNARRLVLSELTNETMNKRFEATVAQAFSHEALA